MKRRTLFRIEAPLREPLRVDGFEFGDEDGTAACAIVGSLRGDEVQQAFTCAKLVARFKELEANGVIAKGKRILIIPCANPFSMNVGARFWPLDGSDINRAFPGNDAGETTQRAAAGLTRALQGFELGIQLCSFNQPGEFIPHVRITRQGDISDESLEMAEAFRLPYVVSREATPFDTTMLNYSWQEWGTHAFSVYGQSTQTIDERSSALVEQACLRFLAAKRIIRGRFGKGTVPQHVDESGLEIVRAESAAGYLMREVGAGDKVERGEVLGRVLDTLDSRVREELIAPVSGRIFFSRVEPLVQQHMVVFRIVPDPEA